MANQYPVREGLNIALRYLKVQALAKACGKKSGTWITQRLNRNPHNMTSVYYFSQADVDALNKALKDIASDIFMTRIPEHRDDRAGFKFTIMDDLGANLKPSWLYADTLGMKQSRWALCMREEGHRLWVSPEQVKVLNKERERIARELFEMELVFEPLQK